MKGFAFACALKSHVFPEMSYPLIGGIFIATSDVEHYAAMDNFRVCYTMVNESYTVRKSDNFRSFHNTRVLKIVGFSHARHGKQGKILKGFFSFFGRFYPRLL